MSTLAFASFDMVENRLKKKNSDRKSDQAKSVKREIGRLKREFRNAKLNRRLSVIGSTG